MTGYCPDCGNTMCLCSEPGDLVTPALCPGCEGDPHTGGPRSLPWHPRHGHMRRHAESLTGYFQAMVETRSQEDLVTVLCFKEAGRREWRRVAASRLRGVVEQRRRLRGLGRRYDEMRDLAREGWSYADDYYQHKWLPPDLLAKWFPDNRYISAGDDA